MHRLLCRCFPAFHSDTGASRIVFGTALGMCLGCILFFCMPQPEIACFATQLRNPPKMGQSILVAVLPVVLASGLMFFGTVNLAQIVVPAFSGLLMTFCAMVLGCGYSSLTVYLLLLGRCLSLLVLFWFLLDAESGNRRNLISDSVLAIAMTAPIIAFLNWLTAPGIRVLLNS